MHRTLALLLAAAWVSATSAAQGVVSEGKRAVVRCSFDAQPLADRLRDALDAAVPVYEANLPWRLPAGERLVLNVFETEDEYAAAVRGAGAGFYASNLAVSARKTKESYVVAQPRADKAYLDLVDGLPELTRYLACHEGVHQFLHRAGSPTQDVWPFWYSEGMADDLAETCLRAGDAVRRHIPCLETPLEDVRVWRNRDRLPAIARVMTAVETDPTTALTPLYACSHSLYSFLAADRARLARLHGAVRSLGGPSGTYSERVKDVQERFAKAFADVWGSPDLLEAAWREHVAKAAPLWFEPARSTQFVRGEIVCAAFREHNAAAICTRQAGPDAVVSLELNLLDLDTRQADVYLAFESWDTTFLKVAFGAEGYVSLLWFDRGWQKAAQVDAKVARETFHPGAWAPVSVAVAGNRVRVTARGKEVIDAPLPAGADVARRPFGVGACGGSVVRFRDVKLNGKGL